jgi:hypothetical protein
MRVWVARGDLFGIFPWFKFVCPGSFEEAESILKDRHCWVVRKICLVKWNKSVLEDEI